MSILQLQAAPTLRTRQAELAEAILARQVALQPSVWERFGAAGRTKSVRDQGSHLTYLSEALNAGEPALFTVYLFISG